MYRVRHVRRDVGAGGKKADDEKGLKQLAEGATKRAKDAMVETQRREAQLVFRRAVDWCEEGRWTKGWNCSCRPRNWQ
ncbi:hypothetical protein J8F10_22665 [Gemmata sp. G18]|uniref:Uncharacterized protein n=1 Tax=Gemmata palustris TaxID=2822762 RepID=A0ABS5BWF5_9BACT|nr:hypothetical protein [Gemmata palustris]MBP3958066.1 hypothetical protein [Gemmata palustris]